MIPNATDYLEAYRLSDGSVTIATRAGTFVTDLASLEEAHEIYYRDRPELLVLCLCANGRRENAAADCGACFGSGRAFACVHEVSRA